MATSSKKQPDPPIDAAPPAVKVTTVEVLEYILQVETESLLKVAETALGDIGSFVSELKTGRIPICGPNSFNQVDLHRQHGVVKATTEALRIAKGKE